MKARASLGIAAGALLVFSSLAHAFLGWPPLRSALEAGTIDVGLVGALSVGWYFGSVAMLVFGVIVIHIALQVGRGKEVVTGPAQVIAIAYFLFGLAAYFSRGLNPHFLFFVVTGVLVGAFAYWRTP